MDNLKMLNTEALAYMGDAVFEQYIREMLLEQGLAKATNLHRAATRHVKAQAQAKAVKTLMAIGMEGAEPELTEEEQRIVKRGRNHKFNSKAKNADAVTYKWATAFEALVGYLYLSKDEERLAWLMKRAVEIQNGK